MKEIIVGIPPKTRYFICPKDNTVFMSDEYILSYIDKEQKEQFQDTCPVCREFLWMKEIDEQQSKLIT